MTIDYSTAFWFLAFTASLSLIGIYLSTKALGTLVSSDFYIKKMQELQDKKGVKTILLILASTLPGALMAQEAGVTSSPMFDIGYNEVMMMLLVNVVLFAVLLLVKRIITQIVTKISPPRIKQVKEKPLTAKLSRALTDMVDIEEEKSILMDHDFDGIQELDNNLPPWWKYGFYLCIVVAFIYMINFHVLGTGDLQVEEYKKDVAQAEADITAYLAASAQNVDEHSAYMMTDLADLKSGKGIYVKNCAVCHLEDGGGLTGPNMTDDYWLYGPDMKSIFKTIKYGANNGMASWKGKLTPIEIQQVSSYVRTLHGTTPAVPKEPQGNLMPFEMDEGAPADSLQTAVLN